MRLLRFGALAAACTHVEYCSVALIEVMSLEQSSSQIIALCDFCVFGKGATASINPQNAFFRLALTTLKPSPSTAPHVLVLQTIRKPPIPTLKVPFPKTPHPRTKMDALRSTLQPLTHNLPSPLSTLGTNLLGPQCYKTLILDLDPVSSPACLKLALSKTLGLGIIAASSIVKIPQILKLLRSRSAAGVSFLSYALETAGFVASLAYNARQGFPFSTWGETALIAVQDVVICVLVLRYQGQGVAAAGFVAGVGACLWALMSEGVVGGKEMGYVQAVAGNLGVASKLPQIWTVWNEGGTGQLSAFAVSNYFVSWVLGWGEWRRMDIGWYEGRGGANGRCV